MLSLWQLSGVIHRGMHAKRLSINALAGRAGVHPNTLSRMLSCSGNPCLTTLNRVLDVLELELNIKQKEGGSDGVG